MQKRRRIITIVAAAVCFAVVGGAAAVCAVFPNKYSYAINSAADEFGLSRSLVRSVVWAESKFDPDAVSNKGAAGLMQLMPDTFEYCATALGVDKTDIHGVDSSLRCGCYYLSTLIDRFDGDVNAALMAYNAGEANALRFLAGETVFPETQAYIRNIRTAGKIYALFE